MPGRAAWPLQIPNPFAVIAVLARRATTTAATTAPTINATGSQTSSAPISTHQSRPLAGAPSRATSNTSAGIMATIVANRNAPKAFRMTLPITPASLANVEAPGRNHAINTSNPGAVLVEGWNNFTRSLPSSFGIAPSFSIAAPAFADVSLRRPVFRGGGHRCRDGAGRCAANLAERVLRRQLDDDARINNPACDPALHNDVALEPLGGCLGLGHLNSTFECDSDTSQGPTSSGTGMPPDLPPGKCANE